MAIVDVRVSRRNAVYAKRFDDAVQYAHGYANAFRKSLGVIVESRLTFFANLGLKNLQIQIVILVRSVPVGLRRQRSSRSMHIPSPRNFKMA